MGRLRAAERRTPGRFARGRPDGPPSLSQATGRSFDLGQSVTAGIGDTYIMSRFDIREVTIPPLGLAGTLRLPPRARGVIVFAHGSGSSRRSPRNVAVAEALAKRSFASLLFDLLTEEEETDRAYVFDIALLAQRLIDAIRWLKGEPALLGLAVGLFGASTGAAAALVVAAELGCDVAALVSRGGRPDLAGAALERVRTPSLMIVGGADESVIELNEEALTHLRAEKSLVVVPGATHLFPERGALDAVIAHALKWFEAHMVEKGASHVQE
jgi:pimeloyl-ACP methyl ester carboxylesterase